MNVLITGAASRLGRAIAAELAPDHHLRLVDSELSGSGEKAEIIQCSLLDPDGVQQAVRGMDAVIHTGEPPPDLPAEARHRDPFLLDWATRGTHLLFKAAVEAGIRRLVYGSTLEIFSSYPDDVYISELWKPWPTPEIFSMSRYLGELTCREFARDFLVCVTALRLGRLVLEEEVMDQAPHPMWVDVRDAAQAFRCALRRDTSQEVWWTRRWWLCHVCAAIPNPKFLIDQARTMGYAPQHNFQPHGRARA
jgi:nucleoside-diphosphate-sugar epimerase